MINFLNLQRESDGTHFCKSIINFGKNISLDFYIHSGVVINFIIKNCAIKIRMKCATSDNSSKSELAIVFSEINTILIVRMTSNTTT